MGSNGQVAKEVQEAIINQDLTLWRNTRYQMQLRYRVQKSLAQFGDVDEALKVLETELAKCEAAIDTLTQALDELKSE